MNFVLIAMLSIATPSGDKIETIQINGFKSESLCQREIAKLRISKIKFNNNVEIVFNHCMKVN